MIRVSRFRLLVVVAVLSGVVGLGATQLVPPEQGLRQPPAAAPTTQAPIVTVPGTPPAVSPAIPSQPAVSVTEVKSPAAPAHYTDQAIWALMISLLIQYLKKSGWFPWITPESSARLKAQFGFVAAFLTAAGVHFAVSGSVLDGGGASITVTGLSLNALKDIAWQWSAQQAWYRALVDDRQPPPPLVPAILKP